MFIYSYPDAVSQSCHWITVTPWTQSWRIVFGTQHRAQWDITKNKDHQRLMVDQMVMIGYNSRLFLTAVTPTAVAQTAVILRI